MLTVLSPCRNLNNMYLIFNVNKKLYNPWKDTSTDSSENIFRTSQNVPRIREKCIFLIPIPHFFLISNLLNCPSWYVTGKLPWSVHKFDIYQHAAYLLPINSLSHDHKSRSHHSHYSGHVDRLTFLKVSQYRHLDSTFGSWAAINVSTSSWPVYSQNWAHHWKIFSPAWRESILAHLTLSPISPMAHGPPFFYSLG